MSADLGGNLTEKQREKLRQAAEADAGGWPGLAADLRAEVESSCLATQKASETRAAKRAMAEQRSTPAHFALATDSLAATQKRLAKLARLDAARLASSEPPPEASIQAKEMKALTASEARVLEARQLDARADAVANRASSADARGDKAAAASLRQEVRRLRGQARNANREAGDIARRIERARDLRTDALWADLALREILAQAEARGEELRKSGAALVRPQPLTELELMVERDEIIYRQMIAGQRYDALLRRLIPTLGSASGDMGRPKAPGLRAAEADAQALQDRCEIWRALDQDARVIRALDHVCFANAPLSQLSRGDHRARLRWLTRLQGGLDVVADYYHLPRYQRCSAA